MLLVEGVHLVEGEEGLVFEDISNPLVVIDLFECLQLQPGDIEQKTRFTQDCHSKAFYSYHGAGTG